MEAEGVEVVRNYNASCYDMCVVCCVGFPIG